MFFPTRHTVVRQKLRDAQLSQLGLLLIRKDERRKHAKGSIDEIVVGRQRRQQREGDIDRPIELLTHGQPVNLQSSLVSFRLKVFGVKLERHLTDAQQQHLRDKVDFDDIFAIARTETANVRTGIPQRRDNGEILLHLIEHVQRNGGRRLPSEQEANRHPFLEENLRRQTSLENHNLRHFSREDSLM